jgi:hypothetical protein
MSVPLPLRLQAAIRSRLGLPALPGGSHVPQARGSEASDIEKTYPRSQRPRKPPATFGPSLLPATDVVRVLLRFRYDPAFRGERRVPIRTLATFVGLSHETLYQAMRAGTASECARAKLTWALADILDGRLRFRRRGQRWEPEGNPLFQPSKSNRLSV